MNPKIRRCTFAHYHLGGDYTCVQAGWGDDQVVPTDKNKCAKCGRFSPYPYDAVRFHRGQGSPVTMLVECIGITIGKGKPEWGAPEDKEVFIIKLGKRL